MSIARRHFERTMAEQQAQKAAASASAELAAPATGSLADQMQAKLAEHIRALKAVQSVAAKVAMKREFLPDYAAYIDGVLAAGVGAQDPVVVTVLIWLLDIGDYDRALDIASYAIEHQLASPDNFSRSLPCAVLEEIADATLDRLKAKEDCADMAPTLELAMELVDGQDMPDEVPAKAHKALGLIHESTDPARSVTHCEAALKLDPKIGVGQVLSRAKKAAEALSQART